MLTHNSPAADYTYTYNARNRRTQALLGGNATTDVINGLGQRTVQTVVSSELFFYDEAGHLTGSYNGTGNVIAETVWLDDLPVAVLEPAGAFYIAPDHLGAPHQITDGSVNAVWLWDHDPFGNGTPSGTFSDNFRFPGQFYDQNAKLHYNYYRDYDPNTGRYIESDPIGLQGGINTYAYVGGNPVSFSDPVGLEPWWMKAFNETASRCMPNLLDDQLKDAEDRRDEAKKQLDKLKRCKSKDKNKKQPNKLSNEELQKLWQKRYDDALADVTRLLEAKGFLDAADKAATVGDPYGTAGKIIQDADPNKVLQTGPQSVNGAAHDACQRAMNMTQGRH